MSNVLNVSSAIPGYDNNIKNNPYTTVSPDLRSYTDPSRVAGPAGDNDAKGGQGAGPGLNYDSNYETFTQMLNASPQLTKVFARMLFGGLAGLVEAGMGDAFAGDIAKYMESLKMTEGEATELLKSQAEGSVRYRGAFFGLLRQVMNETSSIELKTRILDFVRRYGDMASGKHIQNSIQENLSDIERHMLSPDREQLKGMAGRLVYPAGPEGTGENVRMLKNEILPFLSRYIRKTHDMGRVRDAISLLAYNTARYENGDSQGVSHAFKKLLGYQAFARRFKGVDPDALMEGLAKMDFDREAGKNERVQNFLNVLQRGLSGEAGLENKQAFEDVLQALLLNESVYMPLLHLMAPMELEGKQLFSELWIDPDAEDTGNVLARDRKIRLLVKFDIKDVGYFDLVLFYQDGKADVQLFYPEKLASSRKMIETGVGAILAGNSIEARSLSLDVSRKPLQLQEVFPKLLERRNSVNVRV
ncbi:hypothetical protein [Parasporobacterium paucivorans]|uniref:Uncharacterized protein n=1 Tax=Parasporobacterium paucivorans DSM 15970 TaxID=1122934 RepID=A0A1M6I6T1_9FIRM|nr:hypothetical protein [Parasporobacterium paucivorans]SHJ30133.1 hypothetical protein SAMN02745691_01695 [Parasporobacterium paucivorans DSM 15970]